MNVSSTTMPGNRTTSGKNKLFFSKITACPKREDIFNATSLSQHTEDSVRTVVTKYNNVPFEVKVLVEGCYYDRYNSSYLIVSGKIVNFHSLITPNKKVRKALQRIRAFDSRVQLRYDYHTTGPGAICFQMPGIAM